MRSRRARDLITVRPPDVNGAPLPHRFQVAHLHLGLGPGRRDRVEDSGIVISRPRIVSSRVLPWRLNGPALRGRCEHDVVNCQTDQHRSDCVGQGRSSITATK